ncbi:MAG: methyltransferase domain-containing protein [Thiohalospira sp.]
MTANDPVLDRYSRGAQAVEPALCCPTDYDPALLEALPAEILEKDYGCGDPSRYVRPGDTVLDLGAGGGKICYMAAQLVGTEGRVIGVDANDDMLALARKYQGEMAERLGGDRVEFRKGRIEDLALDLEAQDRRLAEQPVRTSADLAALEAWRDRQRTEAPLIAADSVDLVVSNCVLNLVRDADKEQLLREIHRVLRPGGRVAVSDIVSDEAVPAHLKADPELWSGCISGAFQEEDFAAAFARAGLVDIRYDKWDAEPWQVVEGIELRSVTLTAVKPETGPCLDYGHAVVYRGPFASVTDDEGHVFPRGARMAVCERTFRHLTEGPLAEHFLGIAPAEIGEPATFCAPPGTRRAAAETKGGGHAGGGGGACC